ncbi:MAG TPA: hypothetical protein VI279_02415 [Rhodocyclaceae bacterium]
MSPRPLPALLALPALLMGVLSGIARLGVDTPATAAALAGHHSALMIACFFGTVISLERAVALNLAWAYLAPVAAALSGLALIFGAPLVLAQALQILAASVLLVGGLRLWRRQPAQFLATLALGSAAWLLGNLVWLLNGSLLPALPFWLGFLILTIAGERLELTRIRPLPAFAKRVFPFIAGAIPAGALLALAAPAAGLALFAAALLALALWLMRYDIARHTVKQQGLTRYIAVCLLAGYGWLALAGLLGLGGALLPGHPWRDAALHGLTIGFVFSMVFGHAPVMLPAIAKLRVRWSPLFYLPLALLHGALMLRVAGVLGAAPLPWQAGGVAGAIALLVFILTLAQAVLRGRTRAVPL